MMRSTVCIFSGIAQFLANIVTTGIWGNDARVCMVIPDPTAYETSAGGPFMRDINYVLPPVPSTILVR